MTGLLVSVRDVPEGLAALRGGADVIDIKEPRNGSLGAAGREAWRAIRAAVGNRALLSVALGEWHERLAEERELDLPGMTFAKMGLAAANTTKGWRDDWARLIACVARRTSPVAVAYADWRRAESPPPLEVVRIGHDLGCTVALCDTWRKDASLPTLWNGSQLDDWCACARERKMRVAIAGSLELDRIDRVLAVRPDWIAVRGAACVGGREGSIDENLVRRLSVRVKSAAAPFFQSTESR